MLELAGGERVSPERARTRYLNSPCGSAPGAGLIAMVSSVDAALIVARWGSAEQVAEVALPRKTVVMQVVFSADGKRVAVVGFDYTGGKRGKDEQYVHRVYLYELAGAKE